MNTEKIAESIRTELRKQGYTFSEKERKDHAYPTDELWMLQVHHSE